MKQISTLAFSCLCLFLFAHNVVAQQYSKSDGTSTSQLLFGSNTSVHTQLLYDSSDLHRHQAGNIDRIYFRKLAGNSTTISNVVIRLGQTGNTGGFGIFSNAFFTGLTPVFSSASYIIPSSGTDAWFSFDISAFPYNPSQRLIVDITYSTSANQAFTVLASTTGTAFGGRKRLYTNNSTSPTGTSTSTWEDFGMDMAPVNDECSGAIEIFPGAKCNRTINGTTFAASQSFPASMCDGSLSANADDDVWYSFVASGNGDTISVTAIDGNFDPIVDVYNSCPPDVRVGCSDKTTTGGSETVRMPSLNPGSTYFVRVYSFDQVKGRFSICLRNKNNPCTTPAAFIKANKTETVSNGSVLLELLSPLTGSLIWEQSLDYGNTWTSTGQFGVIDTVLGRVASTDTIYFRANTQFGNCDPAYSNIVKVFVRCATTIAIPPLQAPLYISQVAFQGVRNISTFDTYGGAYQDFRSLTGHFCRSNAGNLVIYTSPSNLPVNRLVWIDLNRDGDFSDAGEKFYAGSLVAVDSVVVPININKNVAPGPATMRISIFWDNESQAGAGPCDGGLYFYGEIEEYTINIHTLDIADAGTSGFNCGSSRTMNANPITDGQGTWSVFNGTGTANFANLNNPNTLVTGLANGLNVLQWTASSAYCPSNSDTVEIQVNQPVQANAGTDMVVCTTFVTIIGNSGPVGTAYSWTKLSGNGNLSTLGGSSAFYNGMTGVSDLKFGLTVPGCPVSEDTIRITNVGVNNEANAGGNKTVCGSTAVMEAEAPQSGFGTWSVVSGTGTFSNINDPLATVSGLSVGANIFRWTVTNLPCPADLDEVTINSVLPVQADAGPDIAVCTTSVSISGNTGPTGTSYNWTKISGVGSIISVGGSGIVYFGMGIGTSELEFTLNRPGCPPSKDTIRVTRAGNPTTADAGNAFFVCEDSTRLDANIPLIGTGKWTIVTGTGQFVNDTDPKTWVRGLTNGEATFRWTISNNPCPPSSDEVNVNYHAPIQAVAGPDQQICTTFVQLNGNQVDSDFGLVSWQQILGSGQIINPTSHTTLVFNLSAGLNRFVYSVVRNGCTVPTTDTVDIIYSTPPTAVAGPDQIICSAFTSLAATPPTNGTGRWSVVSGSGTFDNVNSPTATVSNLPVGITVLKWKVTSSPCPADSATVTITRNSIIPAIAGTDQVVCTTSVVVFGNFPPANGTTRWTRLTGTGLVNSPNSRATAISLLGVGTSSYEYKISVPGCGDTRDTIAITRNIDPSTADAGQDQTVCADFTTLSANTPQVGAGKWTVVSGSGAFANDTDPNTSVTGLSSGLNQFRWTISNNPCPPSSDDVGVFRYLPESANAGTDQSICTTFVQLSGNAPVQDGVSVGWSQIAGTGTISFPGSSQTPVLALGSGINRFVYSIFVPGCSAATDTIDIDRKLNPTPANAGINQTICGTSATLAGNTPAIGNGTWTRISGAGTLVSPNNPSSQVNGLGIGANVFRWTISNAPCANSTDNITITRNSSVLPDAGTDQVICTTFVQLTGNSLGNNPGSVSWTQIDGTGIIGTPNSETTLVNNLSAGLNRFVYTISVPGCQPLKDTVAVSVSQSETAQVAPDYSTFQPSAGLSALNPTGVWSLVVGAGTISNPNAQNTTVSNLGMGLNRFVWTYNNPPCPVSTDTLNITRNPVPDECQGVALTATHQSGNSAQIILQTPAQSSFFSYSIQFGDGSSEVNEGNQATILHAYLSPGIYSVCGKVFYFNVFNALDSCEICDTVLIPTPQNPCSQIGVMAQWIGGASSYVVMSANPDIFSGYKVDFGDGTTNSSSEGSSNNTGHVFPAPGVYNVCYTVFYMNSFQQRDSCVVCDTVNIPPPVKDCSGITVVALSNGDMNAAIEVAAGSDFFGHKVFFGDGSSAGFPSSSNGSYLHYYPAPGIYNVCARGYFIDVFGDLDSCEVCDTVSISIPVNTCLYWSVGNYTTTVFDVTEVDSMRGRYYSLLDSIAYNPGLFFRYKVRVSDSGTDAQELLVDETIPSSESSRSFHLIVSPGSKKICYTIYYINASAQVDSCTICRFETLDFAPPCTFVELKTEMICRNQIKAKALFSKQSGFDSLWVVVGNQPPVPVTKSGDSVLVSTDEVGSVPVRFLARLPGGGSISLPGLPAFDCGDFDTLEVSPGPNAGPDQSICSSDFTQTGNAIPSGYLARWLVISGTATLTDPLGMTLTASGLSEGENKFSYTYFTANQSCPEESDTVTVVRVLPAVADAGPDQNLTVSSTTLAATNPTGVWSTLTGTGTVAEPTNPVSTVSGLSLGLNRFVWTVSSPPCAEDTDTVDVVVTDPCEGLSVLATHSFGYFARIKPEKPIGSTFFSHKLNYGDGSTSSEFTTTDTVTHLYSGPGTYNVCSRFLYLNASQQLDSCVVCDTVNIPDFISPCTSFDYTANVLQSAVSFGDATPGVPAGWYYDYVVNVGFPPGSMTNVQFQFDGGPRLNVSDYGLPDLSSFSYVLPPKEGIRKLCLYGYYTGPDGNADTCTVCKDFNNPYPPRCEYFVLEKSLKCRNQAEVKVWFSPQSRLDTVWVTNGPDTIRVTESGQSILLNLPQVGFNKICAVAVGADLGSGELELPGFTCSTCDSLEVSPGPNAGPDQSICSSDFTQTGNAIPSGYLARWLVISGTATLTDPLGMTLTASGLSEGENKFSYTYLTANQSCPEESDTVTVVRVSEPTPANAGSDQNLCSDQTNLNGNTPTAGSGTWTLFSGSGTISDPNSATSPVSGLGTGDNIFVWTISNGVCPSSSDSVTIHREPAPSQADAGSDQNLCATQSNLNGNTPLSGIGNWTVISGTGILADPNAPNSAVTNLSEGLNEFVWSISIGNCPASTDTIRIQVSQPFPVVNAGPDVAVCGSITNLNAQVPLTGTWSVLSGLAVIENPNLPNTSVSNLQQGQNGFIWTVQNGNCPAQTDTIFITSNLSFAASAGPGVVSCTDTAQLNAPPLTAPATGNWTVEQGTGIFAEPGNPQTKVSGISTGVNVYRWTVSVPTCPDLSDTMAVVRIETSLDIHEDTSVCFIQGDSLVLSVPLQFTSFTWSNGATTRRIVLYAPDTLIATGTTADGCTAMDTIRVLEGVCDPVARQIQGGFAVVLQPNPATNEVWMDIRSSEPGKVRLIVLNALGQEFGEEKTWYQDIETRMRLETDSWPSGMYTLKISDGIRFWTGKIVVRH